MLSSARRERIVATVSALKQAERPVRILRRIAWDKSVRARFFAKGASELPQVEYERFVAEPVLAELDAIAVTLDVGDPIDRWILRQIDAVRHGAKMIAAVGTADFSKWSIELYGKPTIAALDGGGTPLGLAERVELVLKELQPGELGEPAQRLSAEELAARMRPIVSAKFGDDAPTVEVVSDLSAKAVAGSRRIRIRAGAEFTEYDVRQLIVHEAEVHVATSLNGRRQKRLPILGAGHPGTTRTQEGIAVFSEMLSGAMDPERFRRLADRTIAIQMSLDGADFLDLFQYFVSRGEDREQAFEDARRVVRGGVMTGGAPFTKDGVYLDGLLRVYDFVRCAVELDRTDCIRMIFCGKLALEDVPTMCALVGEGLCLTPRYLPAWATDLRFLVSYLAFSGFVHRVDGEGHGRYRSLIASAPIGVREDERD